ncbi:putative TetR-family transcriptional regulator [Streptomyces ambofaciens ATCC 23877]|uniref:Putative TetR-family transcriptional regulator n=1 Tax=Streptomyces ambofaciens (strain ATCC 23877 / 3486 / DSM 40053 / JCM 4204 / NBRC 12836 / NRRL B-2516) TaxID=278992 RepID=A0AC55_STRA7|nr:TetR/AcrR family transcriptional regulator C-terminal domain-containing protein [Streptomyces ambofaciens]AKZ60297.1 putative TetR-family transcriptional regulator [Streptomyces ambofaciens ATCC 23877]CAJ88059.1 putative TetR-family transcriptional regulator [Streptomyces ambofaciens ATCC 23877]
MPADAKPITSVWARPHRPQREQLTREQIVAATIELLDAEGVEALSMRKLGTRLKAGATSLYRHVANRDELIQLAVDDVFGELGPPAAATRRTWRTSVARAATELRALVLRHPWVGPELGQVGLLHVGPNAVRMTSGLLAQFQAAGFPEGEEDQAAGALMSYVVGIATSEAAYLSLVTRSGVSERDWLSDHSSNFGEEVDPRQVREDRFAYGLDRILDGLASRLPPGEDSGARRTGR